MNEQIPNRLAYKLAICILLVIIAYEARFNYLLSKIYEDEIAEYQNEIERYEYHKQQEEDFRYKMTIVIDSICEEISGEVIK